jgi:tRNA (adenine37-N6)-methyltransferase
VNNLKGELGFIGTVENAGAQEPKIRVFPQFCLGLKGITDFSHLIILYWIHLRDNENERSTIQVTPRRHANAPEVGVFACRSPTRPNPIGLCVVQLLKITDCVLSVKGLDAMDGSPVIDIKPYLPLIDSVPDAQVPEWTLRGPSK